jgi:hypothetical protein
MEVALESNSGMIAPQDGRTLEDKKSRNSQECPWNKSLGSKAIFDPELPRILSLSARIYGSISIGRSGLACEPLFLYIPPLHPLFQFLYIY